jgi:hypothetical protein
MDSDRKRQTRRKSMQGVLLLALAIVAAISALVTGYVWLVAAAVILFVAAVVMLYQVGKSLS